MSLYFVDEVQVTPITRDENFRTETKGTSYKSPAYVEEEDRISYTSDGTPIRPVRRIFVPYKTEISVGDLIQITKIKGEIISDVDRKVISIFRAGNFRGSHLEIVA